MKYFVIFLLISVGTIIILPVHAQCAHDFDASDKSCDDLELLVEKYAQIAEENTDAQDKMAQLQIKLNNEMQKQNPDQNTMQILQTAILEQEQILLKTGKELSEIQKLVTQKTQMDPGLRGKLDAARDILHESQDIIPWTGLGVSNTEQAVSISIDAENPEEYRSIIEKLVGKDIPVVIKKGGNPFLSGKLLPPLKQVQSGVPVGDIQCNDDLILIQKYNGSPACVALETVEKLIQRNWAISNNDDLLFEIITPESHLAAFYAQPQITSVILKQDSTIRTHLFSYVKEPDGWDMVFDRIFDEVPKNFKIGIIENTPKNINEFVTLGKENIPSGIASELLREGGYFVVYLTSSKSLEPEKYDLSVVSVDKTGKIIQKPLFVIVVDANTPSVQDNTVKVRHSMGSWGIDFENISEQEYWVREEQRTPWPPSPILDVTQNNIHPDVKELIDFMWSQDTKYIPSEYDKNTLMANNENSLSADPKKIRDWLETIHMQQFKRNLDDSFSSYIKYDDKIYSFGFVIAD